MNFDIVYKKVAIESFTGPTLEYAKKYVKARYHNNGAGCSLVYFDSKGNKKEVAV